MLNRFAFITICNYVGIYVHASPLTLPNEYRIPEAETLFVLFVIL